MPTNQTPSHPASPLLCLEDLAVSFGKNMAVESASFVLERGQFTALIGESGSGKSVTALSILKLLPYPLAHYPRGRILFEGEDILTYSERAMQAIRGKRISMIFQEPMMALNPLHSVGKQIMEVLFIHQGLSKQQALVRCKELLHLVGLDYLSGRLHALPHELSGGQRQRVMIAMALANDPELLIADEPTTALDVTIQKQILALLKKLQKERKMAILLITHDLQIARSLADKICVMQKGRIVEQGDPASLFANPQHPYTQLLLNAAPKGHAIPLAKNAKDLLTVQNLQVTFPLKKNFWGKPTEVLQAVKQACFSIREGETLGIVGESGSGKSTLAMAVLRLLSAKGTIEFDGKRLDAMSSADIRPLRKSIQVVFQDPFGSLNPRMSITQIISEGLDAHHLAPALEEKREIIAKVLERVGLSPDMADRYPHEFSGGQRQRIAIARALALRPRLIILDEPTSALDVSIQAQIVDLLREIQQEEGVSYLCISHDLRVIRALSHRILVMRQGDVIEEGDTETILTRPKQLYTQMLIESCGF